MNPHRLNFPNQLPNSIQNFSQNQNPNIYRNNQIYRSTPNLAPPNYANPYSHLNHQQINRQPPPQVPTPGFRSQASMLPQNPHIQNMARPSAAPTPQTLPTAPLQNDLLTSDRELMRLQLELQKQTAELEALQVQQALLEQQQKQLASMQALPQMNRPPTTSHFDPTAQQLILQQQNAMVKAATILNSQLSNIPDSYKNLISQSNNMPPIAPSPSAQSFKSTQQSLKNIPQLKKPITSESPCPIPPTPIISPSVDASLTLKQNIKPPHIHTNQVLQNFHHQQIKREVPDISPVVTQVNLQSLQILQANARKASHENQRPKKRVLSPATIQQLQQKDHCHPHDIFKQVQSNNRQLSFQLDELEAKAKEISQASTLKPLSKQQQWQEMHREKHASYKDKLQVQRKEKGDSCQQIQNAKILDEQIYKHQEESRKRYDTCEKRRKSMEHVNEVVEKMFQDHQKMVKEGSFPDVGPKLPASPTDFDEKRVVAEQQTKSDQCDKSNEKNDERLKDFSNHVQELFSPVEEATNQKRGRKQAMKLPSNVKPITIQRTLGETVLHKAARMGLVVSAL